MSRPLLPRTLIGTIQPDEPDEPLRLAGRVLAVDRTGLLLADETGTIRIKGHAEAGDLVEVELEQPAKLRELRVLTPYRGERPFPSPGGEYHRLHHPLPGAGLQRADLIRKRARCLSAIRSFFDDQGYIEVEAPLRVRVPGLEPHLAAEPAGARFLITSPEYHMKRLLAGGLERILFLGRCWRGDEQGPQHLGEFTMLEWYRAFSSLDELMAETEALLRHVALAVAGRTALSYRGNPVDLDAPLERVSFADACRRYAGIDAAGVVDALELQRRAQAAGLGPFADDEGFDAVASRILVERVEPRLGTVFLTDFPAPLAALAQLKPDDPTVAERFELYAGGLELANAFGELTDPQEQRRRLEQDRQVRAAAGAPQHEVDERFIAALTEGIPPSAGIALGVDRLVMLLTGAHDIRHVVAFAPDEV